MWQQLLARATGASLRWPHAAVLAASVWLAYAADRWIEGWRLDWRFVRTQRHQFYQRQRILVAALWGAVLAVDLGLAVTTMGMTEIARGLVLLPPVLAYLLSHQFIHRTRRWRAPKEVIVAVLLTAGVAIFLPSPALSAAAPGLAAFAGVSFVNCALISAWEREVDRAHGQTSLARDSARAARVIRWLPWLAACAGVAALPWIDAPRGPVVCGVVSAVLLGLVDRAETRLGWAAARVLADVALLTPLAPLLWTS